MEERRIIRDWIHWYNEGRSHKELHIYSQDLNFKLFTALPVELGGSHSCTQMEKL